MGTRPSVIAVLFVNNCAPIIYETRLDRTGRCVLNTDEYKGRAGAIRALLGLAIVPDPVRGDMEEVHRLKAQISELEKQLADWVDWKEDRP